MLAFCCSPHVRPLLYITVRECKRMLYVCYADFGSQFNSSLNFTVLLGGLFVFSEEIGVLVSFANYLLTLLLLCVVDALCCFAVRFCLTFVHRRAVLA